ncbi:MAG TPA: hypothetical protein VKG63_02565 [Steroidobacteraceae bacterium]|nr:hypothetical protein [Steroidobacteraceae bacterium]
MRVPLLPVILLLGLELGCAHRASDKPVEALDAQTGVTLGTLKAPIELLPSAQYAARVAHTRLSFAYLGPVEWNRSGTLSYGLWVHIAPGDDGHPGDLRAPEATTLMLDDGPLALSLAEVPKLGREAYQPVASWGQTAYFGLTVQALRRMAASRKLELDLRAPDGSVMTFAPSADARSTLTRYLEARGITGD